MRLIAQSVFGTKSSEAILRRASPVSYVTPDDPPFLLVHGERDGMVPLRQSELMKAALEEQGVPVQLVVVKHAGHCLVPEGGRPNPSRETLGRLIADFADRVLAASPKVQPASATSPASPASSRRTP